MTTVPPRRYWPYDEVTASRDCSSRRFELSTPWFEARFQVADPDFEKTGRIIDRISSGTLGPEDLPEVSWLFSSLAEYPLAYLLPRPPSEAAGDRHQVSTPAAAGLSPEALLRLLFEKSENASAAGRLCQRFPASGWKWDGEAALAFSATAPGQEHSAHDPCTVFTVARRFHLLDSVESNGTEALFAHVRGLRPHAERFRDASALIVKQNLYVTQQCEAALTPALRTAASAKPKVDEFIRAEKGHDVILSRAMKALGVESRSVPVIDPVVVLMELFRMIAERNFLAFAMVVDMFERSSYRAEDPLATLLGEGGFSKAARQIDLHREINDSGGHENVGLGMLEGMAPVDAAYATEALRLAELATDVLHRISSGMLELLKG